MFATSLVSWDTLCIVIIVTISFLTIIAPAIVGYILFAVLLKRTSPKKWGRECSDDDPNQIEMFHLGLKWREDHLSCCKEVQIVNDGLHLYGEFYDFGSRKTVVIMPGRSESLYGSYYFAPPYEKCGYNVFLYDPRAHGKSDGVYNTVGFEEQKDLIAWLNFLAENYHTEDVVLHGICVGTSTGLFALKNENCPRIIRGVVTEGLFSTFYESFKNHMLERKKPTFPILQFAEMWMRIFTRHSMCYGPEHVLPELKTPILMLHSREDPFSLPHTAQAMYENAGACSKELVWFDEGAHSQLRYADTDRYDGAISAFLTRIEVQKKVSV